MSPAPFACLVWPRTSRLDRTASSAPPLSVAPRVRGGVAVTTGSQQMKRCRPFTDRPAPTRFRVAGNSARSISAPTFPADHPRMAAQPLCRKAERLARSLPFSTGHAAHDVAWPRDRLVRSPEPSTAVDVADRRRRTPPTVLVRPPCGLLDGLIWPEGKGLTPLASPQRERTAIFRRRQDTPRASARGPRRDTPRASTRGPRQGAFASRNKIAGPSPSSAAPRP